MKTKIIHIAIIAVVLLAVNFISSKIYKRFDLTEDKRYTLTTTTNDILKKINETIFATVYLQGEFPAEFKRLQIETKLHLEELKTQNKHIHFKFVDPSEIMDQLIEKGLEPSSLQVQENGKMSEIVIFPWAEISYKNKSEKVSLLKDSYSNSQNEQLESSIQNLEFEFTNAIHKLTGSKSKKIAILKGNGELPDIYIADFLKTIGGYYLLAPFTLDSVDVQPQKTLFDLSKFDLAIIVKPSEKFSEKEKFTLDQFVMNGGKTLWLIDNVQAELDSLQQTGESLAYPKDLGLTDLFFNYGIRINHDLIADLYCAQIPMATGNVGNKTQFSQFPWKFYPLLVSKNNHPINNNITPVYSKFSNSIDTLKNAIKKTALLQSSPSSKSVGTPTIISLKTIVEQPKKEEYTKGNKQIGLLLEGKFKSAYNGRVKPFKTLKPIETGVKSQMIVISDGDIIANDISQGTPLELGVDKWTNQQFGNKEFLLNSVNYLLGDEELLKLRSKTIKINFLDKEKAYEEATKWQFINILFPLILLGIFGVFFNNYRKKKYQ